MANVMGRPVPQGLNRGRRCRRRPASLAVAAAALLLSMSAQAQEAGLSKLASGEFTVEIRPLDLEDAGDQGVRGRMVIDKQLTGDLVGSTRGQMLTATTAQPGSAVYVAIEEVSGRLQGREGSFVLHHRGVMTRGVQVLSVSVVPDSGTGGLVGISGDFRIRIEGGRHFYEFAYALPDAQ